MEYVERLLPADLFHDPRVRRVRAFEKRLLRNDRGGVHEPRDYADVTPRLRRIVKDIVELRPALDEILQALLARLAQVLDDPVDELRVSYLVLHLCGERQLSLERRRPKDPLALGEDAHDLRVAVHLDELDERLAIGIGHRVARLDLTALLDVRFEFFLAQGLAHESSPTKRSLG